MNNHSVQCREIEHRVLEFEPAKFLNTEINFLNLNIASLVSEIDKKTNYRLTENDIGQGIVIPQDFVIKGHLNKIKDNTVKEGDGIFVLTNEELESLKLTDTERQLIKPYFTSKELTKYYGDCNNKYYIIYSKSNMNKIIFQYPNIKKHLDKFTDVITSDFRPYGLHRARDQNFFDGEKIISLRKTMEPHFTFTDFPCYVSQTFFVIKPKDVNLKVLTAILNSHVIHFWLRNRGKKQGDLLQVDKVQLLALPIKLPDNTPKGNEINQAMNESMNSIIETIKKLNKAEGESQKELFLKRLKIEIDKLNELVYDLYKLDEKSIELIRSYLSQQ
jgi:adenine-specific DNA-methyltransferase